MTDTRIQAVPTTISDTELYAVVITLPSDKCQDVVGAKSVNGASDVFLAAKTSPNPELALAMIADPIYGLSTKSGIVVTVPSFARQMSKYAAWLDEKFGTEWSMRIEPASAAHGY